ncbi:MAG: exodeoxyribonuclease III [Myxococcota bacterium]
MRVVSWNVNGLRAVARKGFVDWLVKSRPDVLGVQEVRAHREQVPPEASSPDGYETHFHSARRRGYSGVALFSRASIEESETSLGEDRFDVEGRYQLVRVAGVWIANVYFPNGNGKNRDNSRIPYKLDFYARVFDRLEALRRREPVLVMGDFNTAHCDIDIARPKQNRKTSGFRPEEREELDRWLRSGWTDTFRALHPRTVRYSWWSQRPGVRAKNVGWRIDYVLASPKAASLVKRAFIHVDVEGSDHCPVGVELDPALLSH